MFKWTENLKDQTYDDALAIRRAVFIEEQHVPESIEIDDLEDKCHHVVCYQDNQPLATARLYVLDDKKAKVQRVAVSKQARGLRLGEQVMLEIERYAKTKGLSLLCLGAQNHAIPFYERLGYQIDGPEYEEAGILHHDMKKELQ